MRELTEKEINRQDYVDNQIYKLIVEINPTQALIPWDIEMIGDIRNKLKIWIVDEMALCEEQEFYPYVEEE